MANVYEMVTAKVLEEMERNGKLIWECDWVRTSERAHNRISGKPYSLLNQLILRHKGEYASFKQWSELGGKVRKGEKSEFVVFWKMLVKEEELDDGTKVKRTIPMLRYLPVFHISQVDGVDPKEAEALPDVVNGIEKAEEIFDAYLTRENIALEQDEVSDSAYYAPARDLIHLPIKGQFKSESGYYGTAFHEAVHSTGTKARLNRSGIVEHNFFGSESYGKEELIAEIGSAMILGELGIETDKSLRNSAAYLQNWMNAIKGDTKLIVAAAGKAEKAIEFIKKGSVE